MMTPGRFIKILITLSAGLLLWAAMGAPALAKRTVVITYDVSGSMIGPKNPQIGTRKTAEELEATARAVLELVFQGEPFNDPDFRKYMNHCTFTERFRSEADSVWSPFWRPGDDLVYIAYGDKIWEKFQVTHTENYRPSDLFWKLLGKVPYPRGVSGKPSTNRGTWGAFSKAFPDEESLQKLAEVEALKILDRMVESGDQNAQVIWVSVSDEDTDTTEFTTVKAEHQRLSQNLARLKDRYREMQDFFAFQVLAANFIWIRARVLSLVDTGYSEEEMARLKEQQEISRRKKEEAEREAEAARRATIEAERQRKEAEEKQKEALLAAFKAQKAAEEAEERARQAQDKLDRATHIKDQASRLFINVDGQEFSDDKVNCPVMLERIPSDSTNRHFELRLPNVHFSTGSDISDGDFEILKLALHIKDGQANRIGSFQLDPTPVGEALKISLPDDPGIRHQAERASLTVEYHYRDQADTDHRPFTKTWHFNHFTAPSPGWLAENLWVPLLVLVMILLGMIFLISKSFKGRETSPAPPSPAGTKSRSPRKPVYGGRPETKKKVQTASQGKKVILSVTKGGRFPPLELDGNHPIEVSLAGGNRRSTRGNQIWDIDAPRNTLTWDGQNLSFNGVTITGKVFEVVDRQGKKLKIKHQKI